MDSEQIESINTESVNADSGNTDSEIRQAIVLTVQEIFPVEDNIDPAALPQPSPHPRQLDVSQEPDKNYIFPCTKTAEEVTVTLPYAQFEVHVWPPFSNELKARQLVDKATKVKWACGCTNDPAPLNLDQECPVCGIVPRLANSRYLNRDNEPISSLAGISLLPYLETPYFWACEDCKTVNGGVPWVLSRTGAQIDTKCSAPACQGALGGSSWIYNRAAQLLGTWDLKLVARDGPWHRHVQYHRKCAQGGWWCGGTEPGLKGVSILDDNEALAGGTAPEPTLKPTRHSSIKSTALSARDKIFRRKDKGGPSS